MSKHDPLSRSLVDAAMELHRRRLWKAVPVHAAFLIRVPDEEFPIVATITGHDGTEYGLSLARGRDALAQVVATRLAQDAGGALDERMSVLCVEIDSVADMKADERQLTEDAGFQVRYDGLGPLALAKPPFRAVRPANRAELRILRACLRAVLAVHDAGNFEPRALDVPFRASLVGRQGGPIRRSVYIDRVHFIVDQVACKELSRPQIYRRDF
jgi:hypothetical protein